MSLATRPVLSTVEKAAGRKFRDEQQAALTALMESDPPRYKQPSFISHMRHECPARNEISTAIQLSEVYVHSPAYLVQVPLEGQKASELEVRAAADESVPDGWELVPAGRFGFWYKEGKCRGKTCKATVRSPAGVFCDAYYRPPVEGRVSR